MPIDALVNSDKAKTALNGFLGGAAGGALVSAFTNKKSAKKLLKAGGLVALGGVAWSAYKKYKDSNPAPNQAGEVLPAERIAYESESEPKMVCLSETTLFRAMAAAAFADGHIDQSEQNRIWEQALEAGIEGEALNNLEHLINDPPTLSDVVVEATDMESKLEIYTASVLVVDETCAKGASYLEDLKSQLRLPAALTNAVDARVAAQ